MVWRDQRPDGVPNRESRPPAACPGADSALSVPPSDGLVEPAPPGPAQPGIAATPQGRSPSSLMLEPTLRLLVADHHPSALAALPDLGAAVSEMRTRTLRSTLDAIEAQRPDLVLISPLSGRADGPEVGAVLRALQLDAPDADALAPVALLVVAEEGGLVEGDRLPPGVDDVREQPLTEAEWARWLLLAHRRLCRRLADHALLLRHRRDSRADHKTGLANDREFDECFDREFERARRYGSPLSLLLLDLDDFKSINERFDHTFGDRVLREIGATLRQLVRQSDVAARIGGDEFAVLLPHTDVDMALRLARRLAEELASRAVGTEPESVKPRMSIGLDTLRGTDQDARTLRRRANRALLRAKREGKQRIVRYDADLDQSAT